MTYPPQSWTAQPPLPRTTTYPTVCGITAPMSPSTQLCIIIAPEAALPMSPTDSRTDRRGQGLRRCTGGLLGSQLWRFRLAPLTPGGSPGGCPPMRSWLSALLRGYGARKPEMLHSMPGMVCTYTLEVEKVIVASFCLQQHSWSILHVVPDRKCCDGYLWECVLLTLPEVCKMCVWYCAHQNAMMQQDVRSILHKAFAHCKNCTCTWSTPLLATS